jgi:hypothetical protein
MKDDIRAAFERAAAQADARDEAELQKQQKRDKAQARFKTDFAQTLLKVIVPAEERQASHTLNFSHCKTTTKFE